MIVVRHRRDMPSSRFAVSGDFRLVSLSKRPSFLTGLFDVLVTLVGSLVIASKFCSLNKVELDLWNKCFCLLKTVGLIAAYSSSGGGPPRLLAMAATRGSTLALYRSLLREARKFTNYNVREYIKRRSSEAFRRNRELPEQDRERAFRFGREQLEVAKRQAVIYNMYEPRVKSIMDLNLSA